MKKLIFTVALTAGSINFISANTIDAEDKRNSNEIIKANCYVQVIANIETPCGEYLYSSASPKYTVDCRSGQTEGTTTTYYETRIQGGWNHGSGPDQPTSCVN